MTSSGSVETTRFRISLASGWPGTKATLPDLPARTADERLSKRNPPFCWSGPWHSEQRLMRIGSICRWKSVVRSAPHDEGMSQIKAHKATAATRAYRTLFEWNGDLIGNRPRDSAPSHGPLTSSEDGQKQSSRAASRRCGSGIADVPAALRLTVGAFARTIQREMAHEDAKSRRTNGFKGVACHFPSNRSGWNRIRPGDPLRTSVKICGSPGNGDGEGGAGLVPSRGDPDAASSYAGSGDPAYCLTSAGGDSPAETQRRRDRGQQPPHHRASAGFFASWTWVRSTTDSNGIARCVTSAGGDFPAES